MATETNQGTSFCPPSDAPIVVALSNCTAWTEGQTLLLEALLVGANPPAITMVTWTMGGATARGTPSSSGSRYVLSVPGLTREDEGVYQLTLTNQIGDGTPLAFNIVVNCKLIIQKASESPS